MIELSRLTLLVMSELLIGLALLSTSLLALRFRRRSKIRKAAKELVDRIQQAKTPRKERLAGKLRNGYQHQDGALEVAVHDLTQAEMLLYQNIINSYVKQDTSSFQRLDADVENLVLAYQGLITSDSTAGGDTDSSDKLEQLRQENKRLSEDLRATMDTIGRMLNEYSTSFSDPSEGEQEQQQPKTPDNAEAAAETDLEMEEPGDELLIEEADPTMEFPADDEDANLELISEVSAETAGPPGADESAMSPLSQEEEVDSTGLQAESMMDELEQIDIEMLDSAVSDLEDPPAEPGSLEEEWAKLLEEDAAAAESEKAH